MNNRDNIVVRENIFRSVRDAITEGVKINLMVFAVSDSIILSYKYLGMK